ncbi:MAG: AAA family ATPase, partial [Blastocatellia bacterium]
MTKTTDPRLEVFCSSQLPELFHSVTHQHEIDRPDPFDIESIHQEARAQFGLMLHRASAPDTRSGRILLLRGDSGAGKTHLMRAFRNTAHAASLGYFSYMQMTSGVSNYASYVLRQTLDSLDKPYFVSSGPTTGMLRLSNALAEDEGIVSPDELEEIRDGGTDPTRLTALVYRVANRIVNWIVGDTSKTGFNDVNLIRALLYLQHRRPSTTSIVFRYLRCETLTPFDTNALGGLSTNQDDGHPLRMLDSIARLISALNSGALVVCLDQLEEIHQTGDPGPRFARAMGTAVTLAEIPNVLVVLSCLEDFYNPLAAHLLPPHRDRIENDPSPINLIATRSEQEIQLIVSRRLNYLYDAAGLALTEDNAIYPFQPESLAALANLRTRDVLDWCRQRREESIGSGQPPRGGTGVSQPIS